MAPSAGKPKGNDPSGNRNETTHGHLSPRDATPSPGGIEFGSVSGLILECLESPGRRPGGPRLGYPRRQAEVSQDSLHHRRLFNERHGAQPPAAATNRSHASPGGVGDPASRTAT